MIFYLLILLASLMTIVGGHRGSVSFIALFFNMLIMIITVVLLAKGYPSFLVVLMTSIAVTGVTLFFQNGKNLKTIAAAISVIGVIMLLGIGVVWIVRGSLMSGYNELDFYSEAAMFYEKNVHLNMPNIMVGVVFLSLLGAIMDTAIAITTAVFEVHRNNPEMTEKQLFSSGMIVGKDIMGTTVNTLLFVALGESFLIILWFVRYGGYDLVALANSKAFFQEIVTILIANIGCMLIIPVSTLVISSLLKRDS